MPNVKRYSTPSPAEHARNNVVEEVSKDKDPFVEARILAREYAKEHGHDLTSLWEENISWGHLDSFRRVWFADPIRNPLTLWADI